MAKQGVKRAEDAPGIVVNQITVGQLLRGNQTVQRWFNAVKQAESMTAPNRRELYHTYLDVEIDGFLDSLIDKRVRGLKNLELDWQGLENDKVREALHEPWMLEFIEHAQKAIFYGTTLVEFNIAAGMVHGVELVPRQNVKPEKGIIMRDGYSEGPNSIRYREGIYPNYIVEIGKPRDLGKLAKVAVYVLLKRSNLSDFSRYNEMFGMDLRVYEYDANKPGARGETEKSAEEYGSAAYIVIPRGAADIKFVQSQKSSTAIAYDTLHELLNKEIMISVLGQTLTTGGESGGSYELGKVHANVQEQIALEDRLRMEYLINYQLKKNILVPHGMPMQGVRAVFKVPDTMPKEMKANMWISLQKAGLPIAEEDFYKEFGVPMPNGRPVLVSPSATPPGTTPDDSEPTPPAKPKPPAKPQGGAGAKKLADLRAYYKLGSAANKRGTGAITLSYRNDLNEIIDDIIARVRNGSLRPGDVDPALWKLVSEQLFKGVEKGYNLTLAAARGSDKLMLETLRQNVYRFSGFKNYHFVLQANALLRNAEGNVKAFSEFRADVLALNKEYNVDFLRTEYNHAVATSRMASKWKRFKDDVADLPLLQFETVGDERTRAAHQKFDGIIKPVTDPFWNKWLPPLDYNCRCTVRQLSDGEVSTLNVNDLGEPKPGFGLNWGEQQVVFPPTHPQFEVQPEHQQQADNNFNLPLP